MGDLLVRGGTVVDGSGREPVLADVRVRAGTIVEVGADLRLEGETPLDATGALVTPGFIDTHTHFDPSAFWDPTLDPMPQHGVTSAVMGNCSLSLAPIRPEHRAQVAELFCYVEDVPFVSFDASVPWTWESYGGYREQMSSRSFALNLAGLVGHTPLRLWVMGEEAWSRAATAEERDRIVALLDACLNAGAVGMSASFFDVDRRGRPVPSALADDAELAALIALLHNRRRVLQFVPRSTFATLVEDVERVVALLRRHPATTTWIGLFIGESNRDRIVGYLDRMAELQQDGIPIHPQISPRGIDIRANFFGGMSFFKLPEGWHRAVQEMDRVAKAALLADPQWRVVARQEWDAVPRTMFPHNRPHLVRLSEVTDPSLQPWVGRTLADLVAARGGHPSDVLADWLLANDLRPGVVGKDVVNGDPDLVALMLCHPTTMVSNSDAGAHLQMFCAAGDSTLLLSRHVRSRADLSLERAVWHLTGHQADVFGLADRGRLSPGLVGDLAVFDLAELTWEDDAYVDDLPGGAARLRRPPGGYRATVVAGDLTQQAGELTGRTPGPIVRGNDLRSR